LDTIKGELQDGSTSLTVTKAELEEVWFNLVNWQVYLVVTKMQHGQNCAVLSVSVVIRMVHDFSCLFHSTADIHFEAANVTGNVKFVLQPIIVPWKDGDIRSLNTWFAVAIVSLRARTSTQLALLIECLLWYLVVSHRAMDSIIKRIGSITMPFT
jgi:hypothetical protein